MASSGGSTWAGAGSAGTGGARSRLGEVLRACALGLLAGALTGFAAALVRPRRRPGSASA